MSPSLRCSAAAVLVLSSSLWSAEGGRLAGLPADPLSLIQEKTLLQAPAPARGKELEPQPRPNNVHGRHGHAKRRGPTLKQRLDWPALGDAWQDIKDTASEVTDQIGNIAGNASSAIEGARDIAKVLADRLAQALTKALDIVNKTADTLLTEAVKDKELMVATFNDSITWAEGTLLPEFEKKCDSILEKAFTSWKTIQDVGKAAVSMVASGLAAAGQGELAEKLTNATEAALRKAAAFKNGISEARTELQGLSEASLEDLKAKLETMNDRMSQGLQQTTQFVDQFEQAFKDFIDELSKAIGGSVEDMDKAFAGVRAMVASIAEASRGASQELAQGVHEGIVAVAREKHFDPPALATHSSASGRWTGASFLAAALSAAAALAL